MKGETEGDGRGQKEHARRETFPPPAARHPSPGSRIPASRVVWVGGVDMVVSAENPWVGGRAIGDGLRDAGCERLIAGAGTAAVADPAPANCRWRCLLPLRPRRSRHRRSKPAPASRPPSPVARIPDPRVTRRVGRRRGEGRLRGESGGRVTGDGGRDREAGAPHSTQYDPQLVLNLPPPTAAAAENPGVGGPVTGIGVGRRAARSARDDPQLPLNLPLPLNLTLSTAAAPAASPPLGGTPRPRRPRPDARAPSPGSRISSSRVAWIDAAA